MAQISDKEYKKFSEQLAQRFEWKIKGFLIPTSLLDVPNAVRVVPEPSAKDVGKVKSTSIKDNELYFYTPSLKQGVYHLLRHFRNCGSHKNSITKKYKDGKWFYIFESKRVINGHSCTSIKGNVRCDIWDSFIEDLYSIVLKEKQNKLKL
jgi:hypothetical protein